MIHYCIYKFECFLWNSILNGMRLRIERIRKSMISLSKLQALFLKIHYGSQSKTDIPMVKNVGKPLDELKAY
uniref:Putative inner membrane protein n=1 Tax=Acinetobacter baumannii TaxID=470 RepID=C5J510_ACIBA|nr:putative inner membrane protein [Acinetobacter baumannii]CAR65321.1 putative inner membrane protein [Acinetobacter baumannii]